MAVYFWCLVKLNLSSICYFTAAYTSHFLQGTEKTRPLLYGNPVYLGEPGFPLNGVYQKPATAEEADQIRQYFLQLRHEIGRVVGPNFGHPAKTSSF